MSQIIQLKRSTIPGTRPVNLEDGEISVNIYDGKLFVKRNNGTESIEEIFVTNSGITGSLYFAPKNFTDDIMLVRDYGGNQVFRVNNQGVISLKDNTATPSVEIGSIMYSGSNYWVSI